MESQNITLKINKGKSIGRVLYIVEGSNPTSQVFVVNTESSNIRTASKDNGYLNELFKALIENYDFSIDNAAIYYLFDRDVRSNTDKGFITDILSTLKNSRDNGYDRQGLLLLSYPSIESFTLSNFENRTIERSFALGNDLKSYLNAKKLNHSGIDERTLGNAASELMNSLKTIGADDFDVDNFYESNYKIFSYEESVYEKESVYRALSLLCISLLDLGLIEID